MTTHPRLHQTLVDAYAQTLNVLAAHANAAQSGDTEAYRMVRDHAQGARENWWLAHLAAGETLPLRDLARAIMDAYTATATVAAFAQDAYAVHDRLDATTAPCDDEYDRINDIATMADDNLWTRVDALHAQLHALHELVTPCLCGFRSPPGRAPSEGETSRPGDEAAALATLAAWTSRWSDSGVANTSSGPQAP